MDRPLSFSGYKKFVDCPKAFEYHYIEGDRPGKGSSALLFGSMLDDVLNELLMNNKFDCESMLEQYVAKNISEDIDFFSTDYDHDLIDSDTLEALEGRAKELGWKGDDFHGMIKTFLSDQTSLSPRQREILQSACWFSLLVKARLFIKSYKKWILPKLKVVHSVQEELLINVGPGQVRGILDFTATTVDGKKVLFDNKTSKYSYEPDAAKVSPQLALYAHAQGFEYVGFVVMVKSISKNKVKTCKVCGASVKGGKLKTCNEKTDGKRCNGEFSITMSPTAYVQFQVHKVPKRNKDLIVGAMSDTIKCIDAGIFPRNLTGCNNKFGKPCVYFNKCWKGKK